MGLKKRPWSVTALTVLLVLEAIALVSTGSFKLYENIYLTSQNLLVDAMNMSIAPIGSLSIPLSMLTLIAAFGFIRLWPGAWLNAMLVQGVVLLFLLILHFTNNIQEATDYGIMAYAVFIVIYLNYNEVHATFRDVNRVYQQLLEENDYPSTDI
ncbi:hypothetical protein QUF64_13905 [Anaerolineales bacterium HSG6]|nr:hypothetical protein [Anaerolineales bacterium HSG6]MDM8530954.1 hypothetical protein [Anaerolineales bacterium HSG25]